MNRASCSTLMPGIFSLTRASNAFASASPNLTPNNEMSRLLMALGSMTSFLLSSYGSPNPEEAQRPTPAIATEVSRNTRSITFIDSSLRTWCRLSVWTSDVLSRRGELCHTRLFYPRLAELCKEQPDDFCGIQSENGVIASWNRKQPVGIAEPAAAPVGFP